MMLSSLGLAKLCPLDKTHTPDHYINMPQARYNPYSDNHVLSCRKPVGKLRETTMATGRSLKDPFGSLLSLHEEEVAVG